MMRVSTSHINEETTEPLLQQKSIEKRNWFQLFWQGLFALAGSGAIYLYKPSAAYTRQLPEGIWLVDALGKDAAFYILLVCGGGEYGVINIYFSFEAIPKIIELIKQQDTKQNKALISFLLFIFSSSKVITQYLLTNSTPGASQLDVALSTMGSVPGNFYTTAILIKEDLPKIISFIRNSSPLNCFRDQAENDFLAHYQLQQNKFEAEIQARWLDILKNLDNFTVDTKPDLEFLSTVTPTTVLPKGSGKKIFQALSFFALSAPVVTTASIGLYKGSTELIGESRWGRLVFTTSLALTDLYLIGKFISSGLGAAYDAIRNKWNGEPIDWLTLHTHRKILPLLIIVSAGTASLSYALFAQLFDNNYPNDYPAKDKLKWIPISGINVFHLIGTLHFCDMILKGLTRDQKIKHLVQLEKEIEKLKNMKLEDFVKLCHQNPDLMDKFQIELIEEAPLSDNFQKRFGMKKASETKEAEKAIPSLADEHKITVDEDKQPSVKNEKYFSGWFSWFPCCARSKPKNQTENQHVFKR